MSKFGHAKPVQLNNILKRMFICLQFLLIKLLLLLFPATKCANVCGSVDNEHVRALSYLTCFCVSKFGHAKPAQLNITLKSMFICLQFLLIFFFTSFIPVFPATKLCQCMWQRKRTRAGWFCVCLPIKSGDSF